MSKNKYPERNYIVDVMNTIRKIPDQQLMAQPNLHFYKCVASLIAVIPAFPPENAMLPSRKILMPNSENGFFRNG
ncbi:hypothetical protein [Nitrosomonas communis]|uniref:hypothetical protein n=1 Tax=Nitrosomonas communis TaxID=44574 RepID=UPI0026F1466A|nr:hypothetical protein [Nitrosomonas communis]MCO6428405.1 hypothetical protein [Nitrosomonas communis]